MIPKFKINVTQGVIHIESVSVRQATPEVILLSIDCKQKYPDIVSMGSGADVKGKHSTSVYIGASSRTLGVDPDVLENADNLELTEVSIETEEEYYVSLADAGRYTINFALIKSSNDKAFDDLGWDAK